jgi:hypothetical protein
MAANAYNDYVEACLHGVTVRVTESLLFSNEGHFRLSTGIWDVEVSLTRRETGARYGVLPARNEHTLVSGASSTLHPGDSEEVPIILDEGQLDGIAEHMETYPSPLIPQPSVDNSTTMSEASDEDSIWPNVSLRRGNDDPLHGLRASVPRRDYGTARRGQRGRRRRHRHRSHIAEAASETMSETSNGTFRADALFQPRNAPLEQTRDVADPVPEARNDNSRRALVHSLVASLERRERERRRTRYAARLAAMEP